jgi:hypothetical protein
MPLVEEQVRRWRRAAAPAMVQMADLEEVQVVVLKFRMDLVESVLKDIMEDLGFTIQVMVEVQRVVEVVLEVQDLM